MLFPCKKTELFTRGYVLFSEINPQLLAEDEMKGIKDKNTFTGILPIRYSSDIYTSNFLKIDQAHYASDKLKKIVTSKAIGLNISEAIDAHTVQLWSTSLYYFDASNNKSSLGIHSDSKYTGFITGDYCSLFIPTSDIEFIIIPGIIENNNNELNNPITNNIDEQIRDFEHSIKRIKVRKGEAIIFHSSCMKGIILDKGSAFVLAAYYRSEKNFFKRNENNFGMLSYIDNLSLSPIIFHKAYNDE